jgi:hypothetical protein
MCERQKSNTQSSPGNHNLRVETLIKSWSLGQALGSNLVQIEWLFYCLERFSKVLQSNGFAWNLFIYFIHIKLFEKLWQK